MIELVIASRCIDCDRCVKVCPTDDVSYMQQMLPEALSIRASQPEPEREPDTSQKPGS